MKIGLLALGWDKTNTTHGLELLLPKAWRDTDKMASVNLHTYLGFWNYELSLWRENSSCAWKLFYRIERKYVMSLYWKGSITRQYLEVKLKWLYIPIHQASH